jgi:hypothetical protein
MSWIAALGLAAATAAAPNLVKMDAATQARLGVATQALAAADRGATTSGFARALDPGPLAQLDSDIATAEAAAAASKAEADRTRTLNAADQTVSKQAAEAAAATARSDALKVQLLHHRVGLEWSPAIARWGDARRSKLVADIAAGRAALVRIDSAAGLSTPAGGAVTLEPPGGGEVRAVVLGPMRTGDPRLQSTGLLALVTGPQAERFGAGTVAPAMLASAASHGVVIPREALLRTGGRTYAYVRRDATDFERRELPAVLGDPQGLFVSEGFRPGEAVVTKGASQLFAAQTASAASAKKED